MDDNIRNLHSKLASLTQPVQLTYPTHYVDEFQVYGQWTSRL